VSGKQWKRNRRAVRPATQRIDRIRRPHAPWWVRAIGWLAWDYRARYELRMWEKHRRQLHKAEKAGSHLYNRVGGEL
jgi:hypothetical protein